MLGEMPDDATDNTQIHQPISIETVLEALESGDPDRIVTACQEAHPGDVESAFDRLDDQEREVVISALPADLIGILSDYLTASDMEKAVLGLPETEQREVLDAMSDDELVDLLQEVPDEERPHLIDLLPEKLISEIAGRSVTITTNTSPTCSSRTSLKKPVL